METKTVKEEVKKTTEVVLNGNDIISLLSKANKTIAKKIKKAFSIEILFDVPTGGDFSGISLDVDDKCPIRVVVKS